METLEKTIYNLVDDLVKHPFDTDRTIAQKFGEIRNLTSYAVALNVEEAQDSLNVMNMFARLGYDLRDDYTRSMMSIVERRIHPILYVKNGSRNEC